jgi:hypothetical protein
MGGGANGETSGVLIPSSVGSAEEIEEALLHGCHDANCAEDGAGRWKKNQGARKQPQVPRLNQAEDG